MNQECAIRFDHVSKRFRLGSGHDSLGGLIASRLRRWFLARRTPDDSSILWALSDVHFDIRQGEAIGIIGPNGAGKSTLLKLLAGILQPDEGSVGVRGRLAALIEVGAGFHPDLTGRENILLNGAILGMSRRETRQKMEQIIAFAGLERFVDTPVKRYSSGMYARLGFSIAAHVDPEVLLVDEVLSVGDAMFRIRCEERMRELVDRGVTLVFITHNLEQVQSICRRVIVLRAGRVVFDGAARDAVGHYLASMTDEFSVRPTDLFSGRSGAVEGTALRFRTAKGLSEASIRSDEKIIVEAMFSLQVPVWKMAVEVNARTVGGEHVLSINSARDGHYLRGSGGANIVALELPMLPLAGGRYFWNIRVWNVDTGQTLLDTPYRYSLMIDDGGNGAGWLAIPRRWWQSADWVTDDGIVLPNDREESAMTRLAESRESAHERVHSR